MILVLLGTTKFDLSRILREIDALIKSKSITEDVVVQSGHTGFTSPRFKDVGFVPMDELERLINKATIIISHAGTGSLVSSVKSNAKVIAVPRYRSLGEHIDDHQLDITREFVSLGYVLPFYLGDDLGLVLKCSRRFKKNEYKSGKKLILDFLKKYIDEH